MTAESMARSTRRRRLHIGRDLSLPLAFRAALAATLLAFPLLAVARVDTSLLGFLWARQAWQGHACSSSSSSSTRCPRLGRPPRAPRTISAVALRAGRRGRQGKSPKRNDVKTTLRLTGGDCRGRYVNMPNVHARPMMSKIRESMYSMIYSVCDFEESMKMLDLFSGSGIVGLEALSRGMGRVTFCDFSSTCAKTIRENCEELGFKDQIEVVMTRAEQLLEDPGSFNVPCPVDLVTLTPPYEEVDWQELMSALVASPVLGPDTLIVLEYPQEIGVMPETLAGGKLVGLRNKRFGRTYLAMYVSQPTGKLGQIRVRSEDFEPVEAFSSFSLSAMPFF